MSSGLTYVYCLIRARGRPSVRRALPPIPGGRPVRLLEVPDPRVRRSAAGDAPTSKAQRPQPRWWLVVSSVPARHYDTAALDRGLRRLDWVGARALAHEAVVEHFLTASAVLPMRLFSLFTSDERAIQHVARDKRRIARVLARADGAQVQIGGNRDWQILKRVTRPVYLPGA